VEWPTNREDLIEWQRSLGAAAPPPWRAPAGAYAIGGCFVCFPRGGYGAGEAGDPAWAAACVQVDDRTVASAVRDGRAGAAYTPGMLALREGPLLEAVVRALPRRPDVLLVNASGRDHPHRAGLATELGAALDLPTVGVTHRPLIAVGTCPADRRGASSPLWIEGSEVGAWLRVCRGVRPLAVHPAWRANVPTAAAVVLAATRNARTPGPLREARRLARVARASAFRA
jgi:deoxyribonuclease V